jgi:hypothetical protein
LSENYTFSKDLNVASKSKSKGNRGEHEIAKVLATIFDGHFARVPNSGAMIGGSNSHRRSFLSSTQSRIYKGDLIPPDTMPNFVIECKNYETFPWHQLITQGKCPQLDEWIRQTKHCIDADDQWFVCFKITRVGLFVVVPEHNQNYTFGNHYTYVDDRSKFHVTNLIDFFNRNKELVIELCMSTTAA